MVRVVTGEVVGVLRASMPCRGNQLTLCMECKNAVAAGPIDLIQKLETTALKVTFET